MQIKSTLSYFPSMRVLCALLIILFISAKTYAGHFVKDETVYGGLYHGDITTGNFFEVADILPSGSSTLHLQNVIWFSIDEEYKVKTGNFTATLEVDIEKYDFANSLMGTETVTFTVDYDPNEGASYNQTDLYEFTGVSKLKIIINSPGIVITPSEPTLLDAFRIEAKITASRNYYSLTCSTAPTINEYSLNDDTRTVVASWGSLTGADEYDLEWTFYDTLSSVLVNEGATFANAFNAAFINNATRITTPHTTYPISLVYPAGRLYWRVGGGRMRWLRKAGSHINYA